MRSVLNASNKGSVFTAVLVGLLLFAVGMIASNFLKGEIDNTRLQLSCDNAGSISDGNKLVCLATDSVIIYWIILVFSIAGATILNKFTI